MMSSPVALEAFLKSNCAVSQSQGGDKDGDALKVYRLHILEHGGKSSAAQLDARKLVSLFASLCSAEWLAPKCIWAPVILSS